jgi:hypothetical protein
MNDLVIKWSRNELDFGDREHIQVIELVPYLKPDELEFIVRQPIADGLRDAAKREIQTRALIKSPWRDRLTILALVVGIISALLTIWRILSGR